MELILIILLITSLIVLIYYNRENKSLKEQCYKKDQVLMDCFNSMIKHGLMKYEDGMYINISEEVERNDR